MTTRAAADNEADSRNDSEQVGAASIAPSHGRRARRLLSGFAFVVVATLAQLPRQSGVEMWRTLWAEDGTLFYREALSRPLADTLFDAYAGYALVPQRVLAWIGAKLPAEDFSVFVAVVASAVLALMTLFVFAASAPLLRSRVRQAILAGALLFWPAYPFEVTGTLANLQWVMPVACLLAVLLPVRRPGAIAVRLAVVVVAPLSSPLCVLFLPLAVWHIVRWFARRAPTATVIVPAAYTAAASAQLFVWWISPQTNPAHPSIGEFSTDVARLYGARVSTELLFGVRVTENLWDRFGYLVAVVCTVALAAALMWRFVRSTTTSRWIIGVCVVGSVVIFAASIWQRPEGLATMLPTVDGTYSFAAIRYQLFPVTLVLLALLVPRDLAASAIVDPEAPLHPPLTADLRDNRVAVSLALIWIAVAFVPSYRLHTDRSRGPDWMDSVAQAEALCAGDPTGTVTLDLSPRSPLWVLVLPCQMLRD